MGRMLTTDLGASAVGWAAEVNGSMVCVATPRIATDAAARRCMRELVKRQGGDCSSCAGCLIGREVS